MMFSSPLLHWPVNYDGHRQGQDEDSDKGTESTDDLESGTEK